MMSNYNDLFVRSYMEDKNTYPKPGSCSPWSSPDIIPYGIELFKNPKLDFLGANFNKTFKNEVFQSMHNYIYIRAKNFASKQQKGKIYLYWCPSQLLLSPGLWKNNAMESTKGQKYIEFNVQKNEQYVTSNDDNGLFNWVPSAIKGDHYCLVSRVVTNDHPAAIPDFKDIHNFSAFIRSEAAMGYAQRNISVVNTGVAEYVGEDELNSEYAIDEGYININCENLPAGCEVALSCTGSSSSCYLDIERAKVTPNSQGNFVTGVHFRNMPADFSSKVYLYIWFNGITPKENFDVKIDFLSIETPGTAAYHLSQPLESFGWNQLCTPDSKKILTRNDLGNYLAGINPRRAIRAGSCSHVNL